MTRLTISRLRYDVLLALLPIVNEPIEKDEQRTAIANLQIELGAGVTLPHLLLRCLHNSGRLLHLRSVVHEGVAMFWDTQTNELINYAPAELINAVLSSGNHQDWYYEKVSFDLIPLTEIDIVEFTDWGMTPCDTTSSTSGQPAGFVVPLPKEKQSSSGS